MAPARFYHLTRSPVETVLARLLERALAGGHRVELRGSDAEFLDWLDRKLWLGGDAGFLPHGLAGGQHDALQPILLTTDTSLRDTTTCLMCLAGAGVAAAEAARLDRLCILFDGADPAALERARGQWRALTRAGQAAEYWSEEGGRWQMKTAHPKPA